MSSETNNPQSYQGFYIADLTQQERSPEDFEAQDHETQAFITHHPKDQRSRKTKKKNAKSLQNKSQECRQSIDKSQDRHRYTHTQADKAQCAEREANPLIDKEEEEDMFKGEKRYWNEMKWRGSFAQLPTSLHLLHRLTQRKSSDWNPGPHIDTYHARA